MIFLLQIVFWIAFFYLCWPLALMCLCALILITSAHSKSEGK